MPYSNLKIASVSSEVKPYSKSGGLADVASSLPKALKKQGHEVIIITPFYFPHIDPIKYNLKKIMDGVDIHIDNGNSEKVNFWKGYIEEDLPIYFIENEKYFSVKKNARYGSSDIYKSKHPNKRFLLFNLAVLQLLTKIGFSADIIHCHDWHTGLIPYFLKNNPKNFSILKKTAVVFTIHNLVFQFGSNWWEVDEKKRDVGRAKLPNFNNHRVEYINFSKRAILNADIINTVSETYAKEILTKDFSQDLERILKNRRKKIFGILNGINEKDYNPHNDPGLHRNFDWHNIDIKKKNKLFIQKKYGLSQNEKTPLLCLTSRITEQKGFSLIKKFGNIISNFDLQMIIMGDGDEKLIDDLKKIQKESEKKIVIMPFDQNMETSLYAASDFILIPSRFEPCGLTQMKAMRYGCVPIARHIGGYVDTVYDYNPENGVGNGFVFKVYDSLAMIIEITRAVETYKRKDEWKKLIKKIISMSFSWEYPAIKYSELFKKAIEIKKLNK
jgi:starch synthase